MLSNLGKTVGKSKKRVGRGLGSGRGSKSGRGTTRHQKARESIPLHFEGGQGRVVKKYPLLRGKGKNNSIQLINVNLSLESLKDFKNGEIVDFKSLKEKNIIEKNTLSVQNIKIIGGGKIAKKLIVKIAVSKSSKKAIEEAGGEVIV